MTKNIFFYKSPTQKVYCLLFAEKQVEENQVLMYVEIVFKVEIRNFEKKGFPSIPLDCFSSFKQTNYYHCSFLREVR